MLTLSKNLFPHFERSLYASVKLIATERRMIDLYLARIKQRPDLGQLCLRLAVENTVFNEDLFLIISLMPHLRTFAYRSWVKQDGYLGARLYNSLPPSCTSRTIAFSSACCSPILFPQDHGDVEHLDLGPPLVPLVSPCAPRRSNLRSLAFEPNEETMQAWTNYVRTEGAALERLELRHLDPRLDLVELLSLVPKLKELKLRYSDGLNRRTLWRAIGRLSNLQVCVRSLLYRRSTDAGA